MANGTVSVIYIGAGAYLHGVPARDITADEWAALPEELRKIALDLDLYQPVESKPAPVKVAQASAPAPAPKDNKESEGA